jgi:protein-tyrosine phosphatase
MGNICRSPLAERMLVLAVRERLGRRSRTSARADELLRPQRRHRRLARG